MPKGRTRKLKTNKSEVLRLRKLLKYVEKATEKKRIMIMIEYLSGNNMSLVYQQLKCSKETISKTIQRYIEDRNDFYLTNHKGWYGSRVDWIELKNRIKLILEIIIDKKDILTIENICTLYNKIYESQPITYHKTWLVLRKKLKIDIYNINDTFLGTNKSKIITLRNGVDVSKIKTLKFQ